MTFREFRILWKGVIRTITTPEDFARAFVRWLWDIKNVFESAAISRSLRKYIFS
jgi:hypothetical protein